MASRKVKGIVWLLGHLLTIVVSAVLGYSLAFTPLGFPGTFLPPAPQDQAVLDVQVGPLVDEDWWLHDTKGYLVPLVGIKGNRSYAILALVAVGSTKPPVDQGASLYLRAKGLGLIQPFTITPQDFKNGIAIKLFDEGPNSKQYYSGHQDLILTSQGDSP